MNISSMTNEQKAKRVKELEDKFEKNKKLSESETIECMQLKYNYTEKEVLETIETLRNFKPIYM